jgi:competence protein ComEC
MKVLNFPLTQITIALVLGILFTQFITVHTSFTFGIVLTALLLLFVTNVFYKKSIVSKIFYSGFLYFTAFLLGITATIVQDDSLKKDHYSHFTEAFQTPQNVVLVLKDKLKITSYSQRYEASIIKIGTKKASGKIIVNFSPAAALDSLSTGSVLKLEEKLVPYKVAKNPDQFDYSAYLKKQHIYAQIYSNDQFVTVSRTKKTDIFYYVATLRAIIVDNLKRSSFQQEELNVAVALIMGQKQELSQDLLQNYQYAGAIHILSVSGLHVGLLLAFINFILRPFPNSKRGRLIKLILTIAFLVFFALLAGLRPSVVRSVTMFSFVAIGLYIRRKNSIYYTLLLSMFVILLVQPSFLFEVGFQLSYLALFFILWFQPILAKIWKPKNIVTNYFWDVITVTFAAQLGTLPLSIYYFHQFPGLFFITNLLVIPLLTVIMIIGIVTFSIAAFTIVPIYFIKPLEWLIVTLNTIISSIASLEQFIMKNIALNLFLMLILYLVIIATGLFLDKPTFKKAVVALSIVLLLQLSFIHNKWQTASQKEWIVFNSSRNTIITERIGNHITTYGNDSILRRKSQLLNTYAVANFSTITASLPATNSFFFNGKKILLIDSSAVLPKNCKPDIIVLTESPKINLERVVALMKPEIIVADASNYKSYQEQWNATCIKMKIPFHATAEKGFYSIK